MTDDSTHPDRPQSHNRPAGSGERASADELLRRLFNRLQQIRSMIRGGGKYCGRDVATIDLQATPADEEERRLIADLRLVVKALVALGIGSAALYFIKKYGRRLLGLLSDVVTGVASSQALAVVDIRLATTKISFDGFCLQQEKRPPGRNQNLRFHSLDKPPDTLPLTRDQLKCVEAVIDKLVTISDHLLDTAFDLPDAAALSHQLPLGREALGRLAEFFREGVALNVKQQLIWKVTDDIPFLHMIAGMTAPVIGAEVGRIGDKPLNLSLKPNCNPRLLTRMVAEILESAGCPIDLVREQELAEQDVKERVNKERRQLQEKMKVALESLESKLRTDHHNVLTWLSESMAAEGAGAD